MKKGNKIEERSSHLFTQLKQLHGIRTHDHCDADATGKLKIWLSLPVKLVCRRNIIFQAFAKINLKFLAFEVRGVNFAFLRSEQCFFYRISSLDEEFFLNQLFLLPVFYLGAYRIWRVYF